MTNKERIERALEFYCGHHKCDDCILTYDNEFCLLLKYIFEVEIK